MKLTRQKLRRLINEEISLLSETQVALGLPHTFTGFDLAKKLYDLADIADPNQYNEKADQIRNMSLNRLIKLRYRLSNQVQGSLQAENLVQEIDMLEDAIDHYDTAMKDYDTGTFYTLRDNEPNPQYYPVDDKGMTRMLRRRQQQQKSRGNRSYHKAYTKDKGY